MKRAIITGCNGQDGRLLYDFLSRKKYELIGLDRDITRCDRDANMDLVDITNTNQVYDFINDFKPDEIYHLAAFHSSSEDTPLDIMELYQNSYMVNVFSLVNLLEGMRQYSPKTRLFYAASSHIFGDEAGNFQDESTPINPNSIYGVTKAAGLFTCRFYRSNLSIFASTGILYNHESPLRPQGFVSKRIIRGAINIKKGVQDKLTLGDLDAEIDWGYAPDYVEAMYRILNSQTADDFIIATGEKHSVLDFVKTAFEHLGLDWKSYVEEDHRLITRGKTPLVGNATKLMTVTGWKPSVDFNQMIRILLDEEARLSDK